MSVEEETVYFTEKGVDLLKVFPEVAEMQQAMAAGWSWYDLERYNPAHLRVPRKKLRIVYTTEAEKKLLEPSETHTVTDPLETSVVSGLVETESLSDPLEISSVSDSSETASISEALETPATYISEILEGIKQMPQEQRTFDAMTEFVSDALAQAPEALHTEILEGVAGEASIYEPVVEPFVEPVIEPVIEALEDKHQEESVTCVYRWYKRIVNWVF